MVKINLKTLLQGAVLYGHQMRADLAENGVIPTSSTGAYPATAYPDVDQQTLSTINSGTVNGKKVVDWVFVTLRSKHDVMDVIAQKAALILTDGTVVETDGSAVSFAVASNDYFVSLSHRTHLEIATPTAIPLTSTASTYDFTTGGDKAIGGELAMVNVGPSSYAMWAGDADRNRFVDNVDQSAATGQSTTPEYSDRDLTMTGLFDGSDETIAAQNFNAGAFSYFAQ